MLRQAQLWHHQALRWHEDPIQNSFEELTHACTLPLEGAAVLEPQLSSAGATLRRSLDSQHSVSRGRNGCSPGEGVWVWEAAIKAPRFCMFVWKSLLCNRIHLLSKVPSSALGQERAMIGNSSGMCEAGATHSTPTNMHTHAYTHSHVHTRAHTQTHRIRFSFEVYYHIFHPGDVLVVLVVFACLFIQLVLSSFLRELWDSDSRLQALPCTSF